MRAVNNFSPCINMGKTPVKLYVYDISKGFARQLSPMLLGKFKCLINAPIC